MLRSGWWLFGVGCGAAAPSLEGSWQLDGIAPPVGSSSQSDGGSLEVLEDLTGEVTIDFPDSSNVLAFEGTDLGEGRYDLLLSDGELLSCSMIDDDHVDCGLAPSATEEATSTLSFHRLDHEGGPLQGTASTTPDLLAYGNWHGHCVGSAGGDAVDSDVLMHLDEAAGVLEGDFAFTDPSLSFSCGYMADFTLAGTRAGDVIHLDFVDRSTLPTYTCGSPDHFEPVALDLERDAAGELSGRLAVDPGGPLDCSFTGF